MSTLVTKERLIREVKPAKALRQLRSAPHVASVRQPVVVVPLDNFDHHLLRVLIVDDHHANADTMSTLVARWGHDVRRAYDGATGLALAAAFRPDVLLLDMLMPDVSGFEVARQVRRQDRLQPCFIIAVTGRTDAPHWHECYEAGVDLFLMKPVAPANMQTLLGLESAHIRRLSKPVTFDTACSELAAAY